MYEIAAQLPCFKKYVKTGLPLDAAGQIVLDLTLEVGTLSESVTVRAETAPLRSDVAVRTTIPAKDIEMMSLNGRNPVGIAAMKAGVVGGNFNNLGFASLSNGQFNTNGSRADENTVAIDGAVAVRTRASSAIIGIPDVDALQEVQVLDSELHAGVWTGERWPDPVRDEEWQQSLYRERVVLLQGRFAAGQQLVA